MSTQLNLAVIIGSVRQGRFGPVAGQWFAAEAEQHDAFSVDVLDLAQVPLPLVLPPEPPAIAETIQRPAEMAAATDVLAAADAFVVVTPEYNHSFPASVKSLIDWHFTEWRAKPVGFVSYGGPGGGLRAVEALRLVFAELHAVTVRDSVAFHSYWERFDGEGRPLGAEAGETATAMLDQLAWWGSALREARAGSASLVAA